MKSLLSGFFVSVLFLPGSILAQLPDFYETVERVTWVVDDLAKVEQGWLRLGLRDIEFHGAVEIGRANFRGRPMELRVEVATARIGDVELDWLKPLTPEGPFAEFLKEKGSGVFSLVHRVPTRAALDEEVKRLDRLGVQVLLEGEVETDQGPLRFVYLDTAADGKYVLGLVQGPSGTDPASSGATANSTPFDSGIVQFAFVVRDPEPPSRFWQKLGFPEISITHGPLRDRIYRGRSGVFDHNLGWQRHGKVVYEWCIPLEGPTVYEDHLEDHGEGFHHLAFQVEDIDALAEQWESRGFPVSQSGAWGDKDKPGSGRFAYLDTDAIGGVTIEFLWSYRPPTSR